VPRIIDELVGLERVAAPPLGEDSPNPQALGARLREGLFAPLFLHRWEPRWWFINQSRHRFLSLSLRCCHPLIGDACPKPSKEDNLLTPDIRLHSAINVVACLNAAEEFRSLLGEEFSLHEFLLNQILLLRETLEPC
jgi:hypothetical protein